MDTLRLRPYIVKALVVPTLVIQGTKTNKIVAVKCPGTSAEIVITAVKAFAGNDMDPVAEDARRLNPLFVVFLLPSQNKGRFKAFAATNPIIPRAQWNQTSFRFLGVPILNQGSHGSCVGHGSVTAFWNAWLLSGATLQQFSTLAGSTA